MGSSFDAPGGAKVHYDVRGEGPALLFFHAFPLGLSMYDRQAAALEATHRVVRFDARGFGATAPGDGPLTMERIADDGVALLDHLGLGQAVALGCSMGGYVVLALARRHRDRLRGLVLADTRATPDTPEARAGRSLLAEKTLKEGAAAVAAKFLPTLVGPTTTRERPEIVKQVEAAILANPPRGLANALLGLGARADSRPSLREIAVPTLVICGAEDGVTPPADSEAMAAAIPRAELAILERSGHLSNLETPDAFNARLAAFLRGL
jgi:pimeloyl-ACP methyl ester carboxylesterase